MPAIKSLERIKSNFKSGTSNAAPRYKDGVMNPRRNWKEATLAASELQKQAMTDSLARDDVRKGVERTASEKQKVRASILGPARYTQGTAAGVDDYGQGFAPYRETIQSTELPPRGPKGSPENYQRVQAIGEALHAKKLSQ